jgi:hypothetical protein
MAQTDRPILILVYKQKFQAQEVEYLPNKCGPLS